MAVRPIGPASPLQRWIAEDLGEDSPGGNPKEEKIPEGLLAKFWKERAVRQTMLRTEAGRRVRVVYPGRAGVTAGPDFRDALLEVEGVGLVRGDVEPHLRQQDWDAHGYGGEPQIQRSGGPWGTGGSLEGDPSAERYTCSGGLSAGAA